MGVAGALQEDSGPFAGAPCNILPLAQMDDEGKREYWATLALRYCRGLGARKRATLLKHFGSAYIAFENVRDWKQFGVGENISAALIRDEWRKPAQEEWNKAARLNAGIMLWNHALYPGPLRELADAPALFYCLGEPGLLEAPAIALVGSRQASQHGNIVAQAFGKGLSACGITVVSGMAGGIDSAAHAGALKNIGKSIGVLGTGIDKIYPLSNEKLFHAMEQKGLLLSEFAPGTPPLPANFPIRNRIISGLSLGVVVIEAATRSGSLITARLALEQNRDVFAVPSPALDSSSLGCQNLIRQGAVPVFCVDDIVRNLKEQLAPWKLQIPAPETGLADADSEEHLSGPDNGKNAPVKRAEQGGVTVPFANMAAQKLIAADQSTLVVEYLQKNGPAHVDQIANELGIGPGELTTMLVGLEMFGHVKRLLGARFEAAKK